MERRKTQKISVGNVIVGGDEAISIQSMLSAKITDFEANVKQAKKLKKAGCDILRVAISDLNSVKLIPILKEKVKIPIVADIHFNAKLAIESVYAGVDKIRINPGNINHEDIKNISKTCRSLNIPIRIGINSGSLEKKILEKFGSPTSNALFESALENINLLESFDFNNFIVSIKSSCIRTCVESYKMVASKCNYPLHIGITESGTFKTGVIKSAIGIGSLLLDGIGDTIRVSLSDDPKKEIETGISILKSLGLKYGISVISCPTCGRTTIDVMKIAKQLEKELENKYKNIIFKKNIKIAVMGCAVNGHGETRDADFAITGVGNILMIFKDGIMIKKVFQKEIFSELINEINKKINLSNDFVSN
ncbi:MAG: flavodoxin-dependent (E)-4-hydroxy-3-methylbut-2-enyl-diphosphate synthase [Oscillospiraceae bacterium]|nr:flavodoxin-dependent (E)-4-hydroxy-3-methylbut-2-enyl-diphosphate synthase [Oscillospiraceae bacterium]